MVKVALCQFPVSHDKARNHETASAYLNKAAAQGAKLAVLPEIWNGPYATAAFPDYAEVLPNVGDKTISDQAPSAQLLQKHAKDSNMYIVGGSVSEVDDDGKIYNTCLVFNPSGDIVAKHRKVHLFDISVPGGITFKESDTLSPGQSLTAFDGGEDFGMVGIGIWCVSDLCSTQKIALTTPLQE
jgi:omega-amidase